MTRTEEMRILARAEVRSLAYEAMVMFLVDLQIHHVIYVNLRDEFPNDIILPEHTYHVEGTRQILQYLSTTFAESCRNIDN